MKRRFISMMMIGLLAGTMSFSAFADATTTTTGTQTDGTSSSTAATSATSTSVEVEVEDEDDDDAEELTEYKALLNKLEAYKKQAQGVSERIKKASAKDKKSLENQMSAYNKQAQAIQKKIAELLKENEDEEDDKYTDKQEAYIKSIEAILKKQNPTLVMIPADKIVTDNPVFKTDLPLAVKDGVVYMAQSTLEKSFGVKINYETTQKKFVSKMEGTLVEIFLAQGYIELDGMPVKTTVRPITIEDKIYFPLSGISKLLKIETKWDKDLQVLSIDDLDIANPVVPATSGQ